MKSKIVTRKNELHDIQIFGDLPVDDRYKNVNVLDIYKFMRFLYNKNEQQVSELKTNSSV